MLHRNREEGRAGFWQNAENEERAVTEGEQPFAMCHHLPEGKNQTHAWKT